MTAKLWDVTSRRPLGPRERKITVCRYLVLAETSEAAIERVRREEDYFMRCKDFVYSASENINGFFLVGHYGDEPTLEELRTKKRGRK